jgi:hypothetical protein
MSAPECSGSSADRRRTFVPRFFSPAIAFALASLASACITAQPALDTQVANPDAQAPRVGYRPALDGYVSGRPVEAVPWTRRSQDSAPSDKDRR